MKQEIEMLQIGDTLVSLDLLDKHFICDIPQCKGACCVEGDSGAPITPEEKRVIEDLLPEIWDDLSEKARSVIDKQGASFIDVENDLVTSIIDGKACVFAYFDNDKNCKCAIEKAYIEGKTKFKKPISCHLYPVRVKQYPTFKAVNYDKWSICKAATILGKQKGVPIYEFCKESLIRKFGIDWYAELETAAKELSKRKP